MSHAAGATVPDPTFKSLYRLGGAAALVAVVLMSCAVIGFTIYSQPSTVSDWFELFQSNKFIGLLEFLGLEVLTYAMYALVFLALYFAVRYVDQGHMAIAIAFSLLGVGSSSQRTIPSPCFPSATNIVLLRRMRRKQYYWLRAKQYLPIRANGSLEVSTRGGSWCRLRP